MATISNLAFKSINKEEQKIDGEKESKCEDEPDEFDPRNNRIEQNSLHSSRNKSFTKCGAFNRKSGEIFNEMDSEGINNAWRSGRFEEVYVDDKQSVDISVDTIKREPAENQNEDFMCYDLEITFEPEETKNRKKITNEIMTSTNTVEDKCKSIKKKQKRWVKKIHICDICDEKFDKYVQMKNHKLEHGDVCIKCPTCHKEFSNKKNLIRHQWVHTGVKPFKCNLCPKSFTQNGHLKLHMLTHSGQEPFQCNVCLKKFTQKHNLDAHNLTHSGEKPFLCDICLKSFREIGHLKRHRFIHTRNNKLFECDQCDKKFTQKGSVKIHKLIHQGEKHYECEICMKSFLRKDKLNAHRLCHSDDKPYQCPVCGMQFREFSGLNKHKTLHIREGISCEICLANQGVGLCNHEIIQSEILTYQCDLCMKKFSKKDTLNRHILNHGKSKSYECDICSKCFMSSGHLKVHRAIHSGEKPFQCDVCKIRFTRKDNLNSHKLLRCKINNISLDS